MTVKKYNATFWFIYHVQEKMYLHKVIGIFFMLKGYGYTCETIKACA